MTGVCPDCGTPPEAGLLGLCAQCLLSMALEDSSLEDEMLEELPTLHGRIRSERYQIREVVLGRGGMEEVYRALDLKLRVVRLRPMPNLSEPLLHTLPHDELVAKLHSLTNLRVVRDPSAPDGWKVEVGSFPGWKNVPTW